MISCKCLQKSVVFGRGRSDYIGHQFVDIKIEYKIVKLLHYSLNE